MAVDDDEEPRGLDISRLGNFEENDGDREGSARTSLDQINQLTVGSTAMGEALREVGGFSALAEAVKARRSVTLLKDQLEVLSNVSLFSEQMKGHKEAMRVFSLPDMTGHFPALTGVGGCLPEGFLDSLRGSAPSTVSRLVRDMSEYSKLMPQQVAVFADMRRALETSSLFDLARAVNIPRIGSAIEMLGIGRISSAFEVANAAHLLGL